MIALLFTMGLCALTNAVTAHEMRMDDLIAEEKSVHVLHLSNGVKAYIQENEVPPQSASFRVVYKEPSCEERIYAYDGSLKSEEEVQQFFAFCKEKVSGKTLKAYHYSSSDLPTKHLDTAREIAVIAVGDFDVEQMKNLIVVNFGEIELAKEDLLSSIQIGFDEKMAKVAVRVSYPTTLSSMDTYGDVKESWKAIIVQELLQQRMERCSRGLDEVWVHPHPHFIYPVNGYSLSSGENSENILSFLLWQVEEIRNAGFTEEEFYVTKQRLIDQLQYLGLNATDPDDAVLASYYADQFLLSDRCLGYMDFLDASLQAVQEIHSEELLPCIASFLSDKNRHIQITYPLHAECLTQTRIEQLIEKVTTLSSFYQDSQNSESPQEIEEDCSVLQPRNSPVQWANHQGLPEFRLAENHFGASILKISDSTNSFYELPLDEKEKRFIRIIVSTMSEKNLLQLAFDKRTLEKKGKKIHHVHPMRFLGFIISSPDLRNHLRVIRKSSFKWDAFSDGFSKRMKEELHNNNIHQHVAGFAEQVGVSQDHVNHYIDRKDWDGLIRSLL